MKLDKKMQGFSLIELLVVVAIIGILAAVGTVGYSNYMNSTKERVTVANAESVISGLKTLAAAKDTGAGCTNWADCYRDITEDIKKNAYNATSSQTVYPLSGNATASCTSSADAGKVYVASESASKGGTVTVSYCYLANGTTVTLKALPSFEFGD